MNIKFELDAETYVRCEKAAKLQGNQSVENWLSFLLSAKVGHTSIYKEIQQNKEVFLSPNKVGHTR